MSEGNISRKYGTERWSKGSVTSLLLRHRKSLEQGDSRPLEAELSDARVDLDEQTVGAIELIFGMLPEDTASRAREEVYRAAALSQSGNSQEYLQSVAAIYYAFSPEAKTSLNK